MAADYVRFVEVIKARGLVERYEAICKSYGTTGKRVWEKKGTRSATRARHAVWVWLVEEVGYSRNETAKLFGRDPTTVMHALAKKK